jgi:hypothetical protein
MSSGEGRSARRGKRKAWAASALVKPRWKRISAISKGSCKSAANFRQQAAAALADGGGSVHSPALFITLILYF